MKAKGKKPRQNRVLFVQPAAFSLSQLSFVTASEDCFAGMYLFNRGNQNTTLVVVTVQNAVFWAVTPCGSCKN
jgi:hypothetical protein